MPQSRWFKLTIQEWITVNFFVHISTLIRNPGCHCKWEPEVHIKVSSSESFFLLNLRCSSGTAAPFPITSLGSPHEVSNDISLRSCLM